MMLLKCSLLKYAPTCTISKQKIPHPQPQRRRSLTMHNAIRMHLWWLAAQRPQPERKRFNVDRPGWATKVESMDDWLSGHEKELLATDDHCQSVVFQENGENRCHGMSEFNAEMHDSQFRPGFRPTPRLRRKHRSPKPLAALKIGHTSKGREHIWKGKYRERGNERWGKG